MLLKKADLPLEAVILIIAGMAITITGIALFFVADGTLPYYENGLYGLLLIVFALQIITLGKHLSAICADQSFCLPPD